MTFETAKQLSIKEYLAQLGHHPTKERRGRLAYFSPFRIETEPSFFLNESGGDNGEDLWNDFGEGEGGTIIELVIKLNTLSNRFDALKLLAGNQRPLDLPRPAAKPKSENPIQIKNTNPLKDERLIQYITEDRKIPLGLAKHYLQQVWYQMEDKFYLAIGWGTKGGYELRSGKGFTFKGCSGKKGITLIPSAKDRLYIFESMFDYLSYIVLHSRVIRKRIIFLDGEVIILNSTSMVKRIIPYLKRRQFSEILSFFDKDKAGDKGLALLQEQFPVEQQDFYQEDVNEYLVLHSKPS
ncbi:MAG: toprim domain-containing protein [Saprospiraceae bacterium]